VSRQRAGNVLNFHIPWTTPSSVFVTGVLSKNELAIGRWGAQPPQTFFCRGLYLPPALLPAVIGHFYAIDIKLM